MSEITRRTTKNVIPNNINKSDTSLCSEEFSKENLFGICGWLIFILSAQNFQCEFTKWSVKIPNTAELIPYFHAYICIYRLNEYTKNFIYYIRTWTEQINVMIWKSSYKRSQKWIWSNLKTTNQYPVLLNKKNIFVKICIIRYLTVPLCYIFARHSLISWREHKKETDIGKEFSCDF